MKIILSLVGSLFLLLSCNKSREYNYLSYEDFPSKESLYAEVVHLDSVTFRYPFRIFTEGNTMFIMDLHNIDNYFHAYSMPGFQHIASFGKRGEAPDEMLSGENFRFVSRDSIWSLDANRRQLIRWGFNEQGDSILRKETITLDKDILRPLDFAMYNDSTFIIPDYSGEYRFCWVDAHGHTINRTGKIPVEDSNAAKSLPALAQAWRSFIDYNPHNGVLAAATQLGEVLEIYNLKDSTHTVIEGPNSEPQYAISGGYAIPDGIMGFTDIHVTDQYIYAVFQGKTFKEISNNQGQFTDGGEYIYIFNLKGEPIKKYDLDHNIYAIQVDEANNRIMALDVNYDQPVLTFKTTALTK